MFKVELPYHMQDCPQWWKDFADHFAWAERARFIEDNSGTIVYEDEESIKYIEFPSEAHFHWFLLKI
jgi:hypothetical protein